MFEGLFQPMHLLVILVIALLVFGPKSWAISARVWARESERSGKACETTSQRPRASRRTKAPSRRSDLQGDPLKKAETAPIAGSRFTPHFSTIRGHAAFAIALRRHALASRITFS